MQWYLMVLHSAQWVKGRGGTAAGGRAPAAWNVSAGLYVAPGQSVNDNPVKTARVTRHEANAWAQEGAGLAETGNLI